MSRPDEGAGSGSSQTEALWYEGAAGWLPLSRAFIDRELGRPEPDYRSLADRLALYSPAERHAGWIGIAQSAPSRMARTRAYIEALHNDPDPTSVAWSWLDGDFDLMERVEHVLSPDDEHTPATVDALRDRVGSILDAGGADMPVPDAEAATEAEAVTEAELVAEAEPASGPDTAEPAADDPVAEAEPASGPDHAALAAAEAAAMSEAERAAEVPSGAEAEEPGGAAESSIGAEAEEPVGAAEASSDAVSPGTGGATAADEAWAGLTADSEFAAAAATAWPAAGEPGATAPQATQPVAATAQAAQPGATAPWMPTHFVPAGGLSAWDYPDPSRPPRVVLNASLGLVIDLVAGDWVLVRAVNGWRGWVDGRRLTTRP